MRFVAAGDRSTNNEVYRGDFQFSGVDPEWAVDVPASEASYSPASGSSSFSCAVAGPDDIDRRRGGDELPGGGRSVISIAPLRSDAPPFGDTLPAVRDAGCVASVAGMPRNRLFRFVLPGEKLLLPVDSDENPAACTPPAQGFDPICGPGAALDGAAAMLPSRTPVPTAEIPGAALPGDGVPGGPGSCDNPGEPEAPLPLL
jgi:hypothetical protein